MGQHGKERHDDNNSVNGEEKQLEGLLREVVLLQLRECDSVEENDPHDVDQEDDGQRRVAERFEFLSDDFAGLLQAHRDGFQLIRHDPLPEFDFFFRHVHHRNKTDVPLSLVDLHLN